MKTKIITSTIALLFIIPIYSQDGSDDLWYDVNPGSPTTNVYCDGDNWTGRVRIGNNPWGGGPTHKLEVYDHLNQKHPILKIESPDANYMSFSTKTGPGFYNFQSQDNDALITYSDDGNNTNFTKGLVIGSNGWSGFRLHPIKGMQIMGLQSNADQVGMLDVFSYSCDREGIRSYQEWCSQGPQRIYSGGIFSTEEGELNNLNYTYETNFVVYSDGLVRAREVKVDLATNWPDYVFENKYELRSLEDVSRFIDENNHLPDVPSAFEIEEDGINLGEMNAILLKKIEELTLYVIDLQDQVNSMQTARK